MADSGKIEKHSRKILVSKESEQFTPEQIEKIEALRNAKYVLDASDTPTPMSLFYGEEAHPESKSHYFVLYYEGGRLMIANGEKIASQTFFGIEKDGVVYHSRSRWDYRQVGEDFIDGGLAYVRSNVLDASKFVEFTIKDGETYEVARA